MAESFARQAPGPVQRDAEPTPGALSGQGGSGIQFQAATPAPRSDPTTAALLKMSRGVLAPRLKEIEQQQFLQGMQRAQEGETIKEIVDTQPWYTQIFGPTAASLGARAYTQQAQIAAWGAEMETQMPKLAEQGPDALRAAAGSALSKFMTGDEAADGAIRAAAAEQMAPLFKRHAREHYIYQQRTANEAQRSAWDRLAAGFQTHMADPNASDADRDAATARMMGNLLPFADQTEESFNANVGSFLAASAAGGNFHVVNLFKRQVVDEETGATMFDMLPAEVRGTLDKALPGYARQALDKATPKYATELAYLVNDMTQNPRLVPERIAALNAKVAADTGVHEADFIPPQSIDGVVGAVLRAQRAQADADARAAARPAENRPALALGLLGEQNGLIKAQNLGLIRAQDGENAMAQAWLADPTPASRAKLLNTQSKLPADFVKTSITDALTAPEYTSGIGNVAGMFANLTDAAKGTYFDAETSNLLTRFNQITNSGTPPSAAWTMANRLNTTATDALPEAEREGIQANIRAWAEDANENFFGVNQVTDASLRTIEAAMYGHYKKVRTLNTADASAKQALQWASHNGLSILGGHAVVEPSGKTMRPLAQMIGEGAEATAKTFDTLLREGAKAQGVGLDNYVVIRQPDAGKTARFQIIATNDEGRSIVWSINSDDIRSRIASAIPAELPAARRQPRPDESVRRGTLPRNPYVAQ